jgi:hypothetical protein
MTIGEEARRVGNRRARELMLRQAEEANWERVRTEPRPARCDVHARGIGLRRLQLIVAPSFGQSSEWEVRQGQEWQLIRPRVVATAPELTVLGHAVVPFVSSALAAYFERVAALKLPLRPDLSGLWRQFRVASQRITIAKLAGVSGDTALQRVSAWSVIIVYVMSRLGRLPKPAEAVAAPDAACAGYAADWR